MFPLDSTGFGQSSGNITVENQSELFRFEPLIGGRYVIEQNADTSGLDSYLQVLDENCDLAAFNDDGGSGTDSRIELFVSAGDIFFIEAGSFGSSTGAFMLTVTRDDFDNSFSTSDTIVLDQEGNGSIFGEIERGGDRDLLEITSPLTGILTIQQLADEPFFDSLLTVFDAGGTLIGFNDDFDGLDSKVEVTVNAGDRIFIQAGEAVGSPGFYQVTVSGDFGDTNLAATPLTVEATGQTFVSGNVNDFGDLDVFAIESPVTGLLIIDLFETDGVFDAFLTVRDEFGTVVAQNDDFGPALNSQVQISVSSGDLLFVEATGFSGSPGSYGLSITNGDILGNDDFTASPLSVDVVDGATIFSEIDFQSDVDVFAIESPVSGTLIIDLFETDGFFDAFLTVRDEFGTVVAQNDDFGPALNSQVQVPVSIGDLLFVEAAEFSGSPGSYGLSILTSPPIVAEDGGAIVLDENGNGQAGGQLDTEVEFDVFEISSTITGTLIIEQVATSEFGPFGFFDPALTVLDAAGQVLADEFSADFFETEDFLLGTRQFVDVSAGDVLSIRAGSFFGTGTYDLVIRPAPLDDFSDAINLATATQITLTPDGSGRQTGTIGSPGDRDVFRVQATAPGVLTIRQNATVSGILDSLLTVRNESGQLIAQNDDSGASVNSRVDLPVTPGTTLLISAAGFFSSTGDYELLFEVSSGNDDDFRNTVANATPLPLSAAGSAQQSGVIEQALDVDVFSVIVPPETGTLTIRQVSPNGELDSFLTILDADGLPVLSNDDSNFSLDSEIVLPVTSGSTVFIQAGSFPGSTGGYDILIQTGGNVVDDVGSDDANALLFSLDPFVNDFFTSGTLEVQGDRDVYTAAFNVSGTVRVFADARDIGFLDPFLRVRDAAGEQVAVDDDSGSGLNSQATVSVTAGDQLFFDVGAFGDASAGQYFLDILFEPGIITADDFPVNTIQQALAGTPQVLTVPDSGLLVQPAAINTAQDADVFQVNVPGQPDEVAVLRIQQIARGVNFFDLTLDPLLTVFNETGQQIALNDDTAFSLDSEVVVSLAGGSTVFVQAGAFGASAGGYNLVFELINDDFGNVPNGARTLEFNTPIIGTIESAGDVDVFQIGIPPRPSGEQVPEEVRVQISQVATDGTFDAFLTVFRQLDDGSLEFVALNDDRNGLDSAIEFDVKRNATYFAFAEAFGTVTGDYQLSINTIIADDFANSIQGARPVDVAGLNVVNFPAGRIDPTGDVDVFTFTSDRNGSAIIEISLGTGLDGRVSVFEINPVANDDGSIPQPIRIARTRPEPEQLASGALTGFTASFPLTQGRQFGVVVDSVSGTGTGDYSVQLQISEDTFNDENEGKVPANVFETVTSLVREQFASRADFEVILDMAAAEFLAGIGDVGDDEFFIFIADPVDFVLADSRSRQVGFTSDQGRVNETQGARLSEDAPIEVLILPASDRQFSVQLQGVGTDFQVGGRIVTRAGTINGNLTTPTGALASGSGTLSKDDGNVALVFDFTQDSSSGQGLNGIPAIPRPINDPVPNAIAFVTATDANTMIAGFLPDDQFAMSNEATRAIQALRQASSDRQSLTQTTSHQNLMRSLIRFLQQSDKKDFQLLAESLESLFESFNADDSGNASQATELDVLWGLYGGGVVDLLWELGDTIIHTLEADPDNISEIDQPQPAAANGQATEKGAREPRSRPPSIESKESPDSSDKQKEGSNSSRPKNEQSNSSNPPATQPTAVESQKSISS